MLSSLKTPSEVKFREVSMASKFREEEASLTPLSYFPYYKMFLNISSED